MSGKRKASSPYPPRVHLKHGSLYYVERNKWDFLIRGEDWDGVAADAYAKRIGTPVLRGSFAHLCEEYQTSPAWADLAPRTKSDALEEMKRLCKVFGQVTPNTIKPKDVGQYKQKRGQKARVRCNRELSRMRAVLGYGLEGGWVEFNVADGIKAWKEKPRVRMVEADEREAFRNFVANGPLKKGDSTGGSGRRLAYACMNIAYLTTQRRRDVLDVKHTDVTESGIWVTQNKTGARVHIKWTDKLREAVQYVKELRAVVRLSPYLFAQRNGRPYSDSGIKAIWNRLQLAWKAAGHERFTFHDSRAMGISKMKSEGRQAREISGHKSESTAERIYDRRRTRSGDAVE